MAKILSEIQTLEPQDVVELYELDALEIGGDVLRFHPYVQVGDIIWQGVTYTAFPVEVEGFGLSGEGAQPEPTVRAANINQTLSPLAAFLDDLIGAKFTRIRTLGKFLDAANFPDGNPDADPAEQLPSEVFYINQKPSETPEAIEFKLKSALDLDGVFLPRRFVISNTCTWLAHGGYRGKYCQYQGNVYTDEMGNVIADASKDVCNGKLKTCKLKFGPNANLPYGGFPAASLVRTN